MRGAELILGGLLITAGAVGPITDFAGDLDATNGVIGSVWVRAADYQGEARVDTTDAIVRVQGPVEANATARTAIVTVYEYTFVKATVPDTVQITHTDVVEERVTHHRYEGAQLHVTGGDNGLFQIASNVSRPSASYALRLDAQESASILASPTTAWMHSHDGRHTYMLNAPVFALAHGGSFGQFYSGAVRSANGSFVDLRANGALDLIVENGTLTIDHEGGRESFRFWMDDDALGDAPLVEHRKISWALVTLVDGRAEVGFSDTRALFLARDPTWYVNGTVVLDAKEGYIGSNSSQRSLSNDHVYIEGATRLHMQAEGEHDGRTKIDTPVLDIHSPDLNPVPEPRVQGDFDSNSNNVTVNGHPFLQATAPTVPQDATMLAKILGALVVLWGIAKMLLVYILGLVARDPLHNKRRREIHDHLRETGMSHVREISRATGIPLGSLHYHLNLLCRARCVVSVRRENYRVYFLPSKEFCSEDIRRLALLADPTRRSLAEALVHCAPLSQRDLCACLGASQPSVSRHLSKLEAEGLIERRGERSATYHVDGLLLRWLARKRSGGPSRNAQDA